MKQALLTELKNLIPTRPERISGRALMGPLYPMLSVLLKDYRVSSTKSNRHRFVDLPPAENVDDLRYNWLDDALDMFHREITEYEAGAERWAERIWLTDKGLHILKRLPLASYLPARCIILDATGNPLIYRMIFGVYPGVYSAQVQRKGRIYQYTWRTNGKGRLTGRKGDEQGTKDTGDLIRQVKEIIAFYRFKRIGIICHQGAEVVWRKHFPSAIFLHFGGLRGMNVMSGCDAVFIAGVSGLDTQAVVNLATGLDQDRRLPFGDHDTLWQHPYRQYHLSESGLMRLRQDYGENAIGVERRIGCYIDPLLDAISRLYREDELVQTIERARLVMNDCVVWLMTAVPTTEAIDWVTETIGTRPSGMKQEDWNFIQGELDFCEENGYAFSSEHLQQLTGVTDSYIRKCRWLEQIIRIFPDRWVIGTVPSHGGRPRKAILPIKTFVTDP